MTCTLESYVRHAELFGPDLIIETAAGELDEQDLGSLKGFLDSRRRTHRYKGGRWQELRARRSRPCEHCKLDLPPGSTSRRRYHEHCGAAVQRKRARSRSAANTGSQG